MRVQPIICRGIIILTIAVLIATAATPSLVADRSAIRSFLGGQGGVIAFVDKDGGNAILLVDFNAETPALRTLSPLTDCRNPIISADGTRVVFTTEANEVRAVRLAGGDPVKIGDIDGSGRNGGVAYWHRGDGADYVMYCSRTEKHGYATGSTYLQ
jgi:hypothetical protein